MEENDDPQIDPGEFRRALSCFATGVTVVTTRNNDGERVGITVSSFNSVSLDPPLVLWSIADDAYSYDVFIDAEYFAVNILTMEQQHLVERFATRGVDKFEGLQSVDGLHGVPLLPGCAASFECRTEHRYPGGDHQILVGRVLRFESFEEDPLVLYRGRILGNGEIDPDAS